MAPPGLETLKAIAWPRLRLAPEGPLSLPYPRELLKTSRKGRKGTMSDCQDSADLSFLNAVKTDRFEKMIRKPPHSDLIVKANRNAWSRESLSDEIEEIHGGFHNLGLKTDQDRERFLNTAVGKFPHDVETMHQIPIDFFNIPKSILYHVIKYTIETAHRRQPSMSLLAAIVLAATIIGRKVVSSYGTTSNIYIACIAPSAAGKDHPRKVKEKILDASGMEDYLGAEDVTSGTAIVQKLSGETPVALFPFDELNKMIRMATSKNASSALGEIISILLRVYTSATNPNWLPKGYADEKFEYAIHKPHVCIFATGTPELNEVLPLDVLADGFLSRFTLFDCGSHRPPHQEPANILIPQNIIDWFRAWGEYRPPALGNLPWHLSCNERVINVSGEAQDSYRQFQLRCDVLSNQLSEKEGSSIWARTAEKALKFALVLATSEHMPGDHFEIEGRHMDWAIGLTSFLTVQMMHTIETQIGKTPREKDAQQILEYIEKGRTEGCSLSQIARRFRSFDSRYRKELMDDLTESRDVYITKEVTTGRPKLTAYCREYLPQKMIDAIEGEPITST